jgi:MFS family permease
MFLHRSLFKDPKFLLLFFGLGIATFPLLVPPFFIPLYSSSIGISTGVGSTLLAVFNLSSAFGRVGFGQLSNLIGPISSLSLAMIVSALSMLAIWPVSKSLTLFVVFIVINGLGNGRFFSTMPSVVRHVYGPTRVPTALAMVVTTWGTGYIMV